MIYNQTKEQEAEFSRLCELLCRQFGQEVMHDLCGISLRWGQENHADMRQVHDYAIHKAKTKLSAPIMDDVEYEEIIKAQDLMENL